jgi:hypothetical protein
MQSEFDATTNVHIVRDHEGIVREVFHTEEAVLVRAPTPQLAAREYLERFSGTLGIGPDQMHHLFLSPEETPTDDPVEYRFLDEKTQFDTTTVVFSQTCFALPVWRAGLAITMLQNPMRVVSAQSTRHAQCAVERPTPETLRRLESLDSKTLVRHLGVEKEPHGWKVKSLAFLSRRLVIYRYWNMERLPGAERVIDEGGPDS